MTKVDLTKFAKRLQSRLSSRGFKFSLQECREALINWVGESLPTDEQLASLVDSLTAKAKSGETTQPSNDLAIAQTAEEVELSLAQPQPAMDEIANNPPQTEEEKELINELALAKSESNLPKKSNPSEMIPQSEVKEMVSQTFANQPEEFRSQITNYALEHSFHNVREVQSFLEQLRSLEFSLLTQTLQDHLNRRSSMLIVLNEVIQNQQQKNKETRDSFFESFNSRLTIFQQEMAAKLSKQGL